MQFLHDHGLRASISENISRFDRREIDEDGLRRAAVALVVARGDYNDSAHVLLTLRPLTIKRHANQYALPGGRLEEGESVVEAALRELEEELRLTLPQSDVLGVLDDYPTRSGFAITPVVVWCEETGRLDPDPDEVALIFHIPCEELDGEGIPLFMETEHSEHPILYSELPVLGHRMFSPTASILYQFREVALRGNDTRVAHYSQPEFAWK